jgi:hypothetical protein
VIEVDSMKKSLTILITLLLIFTVPVLAVHEDGHEEIAEEENELTDEDAGITPDSPLWGVERAFERINLALTFDKAAKARKRLVIARERLAETSAMVKAKKLDHAARAQERHDRVLEEAEKDISEVSDEEEIDLGEKIYEHKSRVKRLSQAIRKQEHLSEAEQERAELIISKIEEKSSTISERLDLKAEKILERIRNSNRTAEEIEQLEKRILAKVDERKEKIEVQTERKIEGVENRTERKIERRTAVIEKLKDINTSREERKEETRAKDVHDDARVRTEEKAEAKRKGY